MSPFAPLLAIGVGVVFWLAQVVDLMRRRDDEFPGRFDKPLWVAIVVLISVFGAFAYWLWKPRNDAIGSPEHLNRVWAKIKEKQASSDNGPRPES